MTKTPQRVELWTDGACSGNPGPGGWGYLTDDGRHENFGHRVDTTNQRMEVEATGQGLLALYRDEYYSDLKELVVVTDSRYVVDCFTKKWHEGWERRGWKTAKGQPVKNEKLWRTTIRVVKAWEARGVRVSFQWVKGHAGHGLNERADQLAVRGREKARVEARQRR